MDNNINYDILFKINGTEVNAVVSKLGNNVLNVDAAVNKVDRSWKSAVGNITSGIGRIQMTSVLDQVDRVASGLESISKPGKALSSNMYELSAITGVTGKKLQEIEGYARGAALEFGGSASDNVESYKLILSKLSPEIAKVPVALKSMGENVSIASKLMGNDSVAATNLLTTSMNQYKVSLDDPIAASKEMGRQLNVMAACAKEGSAELPEVMSALEQAGMAAKASNVSFEETNALIQVLDKSGKKGAEGGVAIRNVLATLSEGRFLPKDTTEALHKAGVSIKTMGDNSIPLASRLGALKPILNDSALLTKLFGKENSNAALALISGTAEIERLTGAVTGTNTAMEQAAIIMESPAEKAARLQAKVDDLKISLFNGTNGWMGYASVIGDTTRDITNMWPAVDLLGKGVVALIGKQRLQALWTAVVSTATTVWSAATGVLSATMWGVPIVWIVAAVIALVAAISYVIYKTDGWGKMWDHTVKGAKYLWEAFTATGKLQFDTMVNGFMIGLDLIKKAWYDFKNALGIGDEAENNAMLDKISQDVERRKNVIRDEAKNAADLWGKSAVEFKAAAGSLSWNSNKDVKGDIAKAIGMPGAAGPGAGKAGATGSGSAGSLGTKANQAIATGGTKSTTVNVTIGSQTFTLNANTASEGIEKLRDRLIDEITRGIQMGAALGAQ